MYARLLWALASDPRVPPARKALLVIAGLYIVSPVDLIPDRVPFVGALDDFAVMALAIDAFLEGLPPAVISEKLDQLGIERTELDSDLAHVRRLVPRPLRAAVAALPAVIDLVGRYVSDFIAQKLDSTEEAGA